MLGMVRKRPDDQLDYDVTFERWLPEGDTIRDATAVADPAPVLGGVKVDRVQVFGAVVKVWLSEGLEGNAHDIIVTASTTGGRVKEAKFSLRITGC
jgi:hypothetical protein